MRWVKIWMNRIEKWFEIKYLRRDLTNRLTDWLTPPTTHTHKLSLFALSHTHARLLHSLKLSLTHTLLSLSVSGSLGVVTELTLQCIPQMNLLEQSSVCDRNKMSVNDHVDRLRTYRHVRYMWVPFTDTVVIVTSNPTTKTVLVNDTGSVPVTAAAGKYSLIDCVYF